jgi:hypothetical protein
MNAVGRLRWLRVGLVPRLPGLLPVLLPVLLLGLLLAACTAPEMGPGEPLRPDANSGLAVVSLTRSGWRDFDLLVEVKGQGQWLGRAIVLLAQANGRDWRGGPDWLSTPADAPEGRLVVLRLAPGTYRIERWNGLSARHGFSGGGYHVYSNVDGLTFTVAPGGVTYVGNLRFEFPAKLNWDAMIVPSTYRIQINDRRERDLALLQGKFPGTDLAAARTELFRFPQVGQPLRYFLINYNDSDAEPPDL